MGLLACGLYLASEAYLLSFDLGLPLDDSWIHLQFARQLAQGAGLTYNPGELVTGSTAPLWTALLSLVFLLPGSPVLWSKLLGAAIYAVGIRLTWALGRELGLPPGYASLAAALTAGTSWLVWSALSAMEIPLFVALSLGGMLLHLRERRSPELPPLALGVLALSTLARPEGALLTLLAVADRLLVVRRGDEGAAVAVPGPSPVLKGLGLAALALGAPLLFHALVGGSVLPTTFAVKGSSVMRWLPEPRYLYVIFGIFFRAQPYVALLVGAGVVALIGRLGGPRDRGLLPALWLLGLPLAYSLMSPLGAGLIAGNFGRYYFPMLPVATVLAIVGLESALAEARADAWSLGRWRMPAVGLGILLLAWPTVTGLVRGAGAYAQNVANVQDGDVAVARWLAPRLAPQAVLAVNDIGAFKYLLPNPVLDLVGIVSPDVRRQVMAATASGVPRDRALLSLLEERRPDYVVVFPEWLPILDEDPRFEVVHRVLVRDNITMGGDEIAVYSTPWNRYPLAPELSAP